MRWILLALTLTFSVLYADPPDINSPSPDENWTVQARWVNGEPSQDGYLWTLSNRKTGKVFFAEKPDPDEILPHRFEVLWSPNSKYAAINIYYGRIVYGVVVIRLTDDPVEINPLPSDPKASLEQTLLRREDIPLWDGSGEALTCAERWLDGSSLVVVVNMKTRIKDKVSGQVATLGIRWRKTVKFEGNKGQVVNQTCDIYDKEEVDN